MQPDALASWIKTRAIALGFDECRIAKAVMLDDDAHRLEDWLHNGYGGTMSYLERHFDLRVDPRKLVPGAKSVITFLMNYFPDEILPEQAPKVARYAWGNDYHEVIRARLNILLEQMRTEIGAIDGRGFVDSAPVLERSWAVRSGLGWVAKNGNLIHPKRGSYFFIATLITDLELPEDAPFRTDHCGTCTRCIDVCPTGAIVSPTVIDARKCISYLTIELKEAAMPTGFEHRNDDWIFGCDVCQEVCPWNRFATPHRQSEFTPIPEILSLSTSDWEQLTEEQFRKTFRHSPISRAKWKGIQRNLKAIRKNNSGSADL
jgi:epoxyqueuosine reductase